MALRIDSWCSSTPELEYVKQEVICSSISCVMGTHQEETNLGLADIP